LRCYPHSTGSLKKVISAIEEEIIIKKAKTLAENEDSGVLSMLHKNQ
jgi:hypothetical protein